MNYELKVDETYRYIYYRHTGLIECEEIGEVWRQLLEMKEFVEMKYNLLTDYRDAEFNFTLEDTGPIDEFFLTIKDIIKDKKQAVIADKPFTTALTMLYAAKMYDEAGFSIQVFSTEKAALAWLNN